MKRDVAFLISSEEAEHISDIPQDFTTRERWFVPEDESETWVSLTFLEGLRSIGPDPEILRSSEGLPVFCGPASPIDTVEHGDELTVRALSLISEAVGVVYVSWEYQREFAMEFMIWMERFFCYSQKDGRTLI
ncbi:hypothetical protein [Candidatus Methanocrinis natronophilus]|uniref:Uncharacterized protein n=1 Tax=Candidatus Methanocrinis natronophilus TaxID=3033396 RepID=A0ABT5X688_9EURY|nr:hypothetical protein [Candidatus Methanocrinis natronophilus]MDF0590213.1 hypothetical protein [Candidatus Methanocrinis natronophilus]